MGTLLLLLFIIFIVIPLVRLLWRIMLIGKSFKQAHRNMRSAFDAANNGNSSASQRNTKRKKKKIGPNVGEFVAFEEIKTTEASSAEHKTSERTQVKPEPQIEDAVWEEVK